MQDEQNQNKSPIETVFLLNLRESLMAYQNYFESLLKEKEQLEKKLKSNLML